MQREECSESLIPKNASQSRKESENGLQRKEKRERKKVENGADAQAHSSLSYSAYLDSDTGSMSDHGAMKTTHGHVSDSSDSWCSGVLGTRTLT